jgi:hypothetical protein
MLRTQPTVTSGQDLDLKSRILERIRSQPTAVWAPADFLDLGSRAAVDKALQRLVLTKQLRRIDRGLYDQPRVNRLTGQATVPDPRAVINAVARRDQARILVDPMTAANDLGLTTAVPARIVVLTDARLRPIQLGNLEIRFKTAAPSRLFWADRPAMRVVQALYWLHDLLADKRDRIMARLVAILHDPAHGPAIREDLESGLPALPSWMQSIVREILHTAPPVESVPDNHDTPAHHPPSVQDAAKRRRRS